MNSQKPQFSVELLVNAPYRSRGNSSLSYHPRHLSETSRQKSNQSPVLGSPAQAQTPLLNKSKQLIQGSFQNRQDYIQFADNCSMILSKKQKNECPDPSKSDNLSSMFRNIKEALKQNEKKENKISPEKLSPSKADPKKECFLVMRSQLHHQLYASEDKMQYFRLTRAANEYTHNSIKNSLKQSNQKYILNPFAESSTVQCRSVMLAEQNKQKELTSMIENSIFSKKSLEEDKSKIVRSLSKSSAQKSMSFNLNNESDSTYHKKIKNYLQFLFKTNYSNGIYVDLSLAPYEDTQTQLKKYKVYIGRGNNAALVESVIKRRFWWDITKKMNENEEIDFYWSQNTIAKVHQRQKKHERTTVKKEVRGAASSVNLKRKQVRETYELNLKILNPQDSLSVEKYILPQGFSLPFSEPFTSDTLSNHLPSNQAIGSKKNLFKSLLFYHNNITKKDPFNYIPQTYHVHSLADPDYSTFIQQNQKEPSKIWIIKPGENTNRGKSIFLSPFKDVTSFLEKEGQDRQMTYIIQSYINKPLLYNGRKFDIRHFMLLTSVNGSLKAYWYRDGYIRTSSEKFDLQNASNLFIHLTNDAIQKQSELYQKYQPANKLSYSEFQRYLENCSNGKAKFEDILNTMKEIACDIVKANYRVLDSKRMKNNFEIIGLDFMVDREYKPWLIEANYNPCLEVNCLVLERIIPALLQNSFRIALDPLFPPPSHYPPSKRFNLSDAPLKHLKYELIFDEKDLLEPIINNYPFECQKEEQTQFEDRELME